MIVKVLILILTCFVQVTIQELSFLPGVDELRSGYDAAKMLSASEQRSRFRIFDLNDRSTTPFILKQTGRKQRSFATPALAQATDVSTRKENNCQSISFSYDEFYSSYFQSTSFGVGVGLPGVAYVGLQYHETLKRVYEAITTNSQAVGTSTIWWGLYSIQLGPAFLLKFDPMFTASVNLLISEATNPTSESQQTYYNEFIQTYGTHYVSNVIVGGMANLYTFVAESAYKSTSYEEITHEISLTAQYKEFSFQTGTQTAEIYKHISETFKKNSNTLSVFQPPVNSKINESVLQTWLDNAGDQPVVINRTVSNIANLIRSNSQVQAHLRQTIDFYLTNGILPTLADLNSGAKLLRLDSLPPTPVGPISGLDVVGCGYDILTLQSRSCILDTSNSSENEVWSDPYNQNVSYSLPNGFFATNTPESLTVDATVLVTSVEDYFRYTVRVESWTRSGFGYEKHVEKRTTEFYRRFYQDYYNLVLRLKQIGWYTLAVSIFPYPKLNPVAKKAFATLPSTFNTSDIDIWQDFISSYGTHLVVASQMGGQVWAETWYEKCLTYEHTEVWIDEQVRRTYIGIFREDSSSQSHTLAVDEEFKQFSIFSSELLGGTESIAPDKWEEWAPTVKDDPRPISYRLVPLYEILPEGNQRSALQEAIEYITEQAEMADQAYIASLESVRGPPPTVCSRNRVRRDINSTTNSSKDTDAEIRKALCPYVGYDGSTCAGSTDRQAFVPVYRRLPVGVGMTLDITTGNLLLPAIDFTHDNTTSWQDPLTNEVYWYPREVSVLPVDENENQPIARVFLGASELANQWKYAQTQGDWLGGEFGHSQSMLDLQARFFSDDQAIAITQKPQVLYRLKVEVLKLNTYVTSAINALPKVYNENIYSDFLRNWGTHIVLNSLVGGMREQQVLFKDCVFSFNGAITPENLDAYLKQDILDQTLGNSFYAERRKISIDHKLGGNPALSNVTEWQRSLGANPALLKIEQFTPWYEIVEDPDVKANLQRIIQNRTDAYEQLRVQQEEQIMNQRANARILAWKASIGLLNGDTCQITTPVTLDSVATCSSGCATGLAIKSSTGPLNDLPLWYIRDPATGFVQARVRLQDGSVLNGARVNVGCSMIPVSNMVTKSAHICVGCTLVNSFSNACTCVCPAYPTPPTTTTQSTPAR